MYKTERIQTLLSRIEEAINLIEKNSSHIKSAQDFYTVRMECSH